MGTAPVIGVVGGYGQVGRHTLRTLRDWGVGRLRAGGRDPARLAAVAAELSDGTTTCPVEVTDEESLAAFCAGCATVVNCAGPAADIGDAVARAAARAGVGYVDAAGDDTLYEALAALPGARDRVAVVSAGMMPGLSGLLPAHLAATVPAATALTAYVGGCDGFTRGAAVDYLHAADNRYGEPLAAWRDGTRRSRVLATRDGVEVPFFAEPVTLRPYLSTETERLATRLGLVDVDWYSAFVGSHVLAALGTAAVAGRDAVAALCRAAELDAFGRTRYQLLVFELSGSAGARGLVCRGTGASALTGAAAALGALAVTTGMVGAGVHHLAEVLDPAWAVDHLRRSTAVTSLRVLDGPLPSRELVEEGTL